MDPSRDPSYAPRNDERMPPLRDRRWKTLDIIALVVLLVAFWPLGLAFLVWKFWNDRKPAPIDLEDVLRDAGTRCEDAFRRWSAGAWSFTAGAGTTGNAAFDAYVARREAEIAAERRALDEEIAEFRRFMDRRRDDADLYEEFRGRHARGA